METDNTMTAARGWRAEAAERKAACLSAMARAGVYIAAEFVPFSHSRNAKKGARVTDMQLNWRVRLYKVAPSDVYGADAATLAPIRPVLESDYSAGIGHAPSYKQRITLDVESALKYECEHGKRHRSLPSLGTIGGGAAILPDPVDVFHSLLLDGSAIDSASFEDWASEFGYDTDSRKAETMYRECVATGLALRSAFGDAALNTLRTAFQDY